MNLNINLTFEREIRNTVQCVDIKYYRTQDELLFFVITSPIGMKNNATLEKVNSHIGEFNKAIISMMEAALSMHEKKFVHTDIR